MSGAGPTPLKTAAAVVGLVLYASAVHYVNGHPDMRRLGALLAVLPVLALLLDIVRRLRPPGLALFAALVVLALTVAGWRQAEAHFDWLLLAQQLIAYVLLAGLFGASLLPGHTPLCTRLASALQGELDRPTRLYTRQVTLAWACLLAGIAVTMSILYGLHLMRAWSLFANFGPLVLLPVMFIVELQVRRHRLPQSPRIGLLQVWHAWHRRDRSVE